MGDLIVLSASVYALSIRYYYVCLYLIRIESSRWCFNSTDSLHQIFSGSKVPEEGLFPALSEGWIFGQFDFVVRYIFYYQIDVNKYAFLFAALNCFLVVSEVVFTVCLACWNVIFTKSRRAVFDINGYKNNK